MYAAKHIVILSKRVCEYKEGRGQINMMLIFSMDSVYYSDDSAFEIYTDIVNDTHGYWPGFDQPHMFVVIQ